MSSLAFEAVSHGELRDVSATFAEGGRVLLGTESDGTDTLLSLAAGLFAARRGRVTLSGVSPADSSAARRGIASLFARESLPPARSVLGALELALSARGDARSALSVLDAAGLASWATLRPARLSARETRALALGFALSHPAPTLFVLHEPLALLGLLNEDFVLGVLASHAEAVVLCSASQPAEAAKLGPIAGTLSRGQWWGAWQAGTLRGALSVRVSTPEPSRLAERLRGVAGISAVEWSGGHELLVRGDGLEPTARSIVGTARAEGIRISALKPDAPALAEYNAARATAAAIP